MNIAIAADHGGFELKEKLKNYYANFKMLDLGTYSADAVDYPDFAAKMAKTILAGKADLGILICGTGVGISIAANRFKGIRAALLYSAEVARLAKAHNNANVLVFGGRTMSVNEAIERIDIFLQTKFEGERHQRRLNKIDEME